MLVSKKSRSKPLPSPSQPTKLQQLHERPSFLIRRAHQAAVAAFESKCGNKFGITNTQYGMLMAIASTAKVDVIGAARLVGIDRTTANVTVRNLTKRGLIEGAINAKDRRRLQLVITASGKKLLREGQAAIDEVQETYLANLSQDERRQLVHLLKRLSSALPETKP